MTLPTGEFKYIFKPDPPKPKPPFDVFWELLGKFVKSIVLPTAVVVLVIYCTLEVAAGRNPLEQFLPRWINDRIPEGSLLSSNSGISLPDTAVPGDAQSSVAAELNLPASSTYRIVVMTTPSRTNATRALQRLKRNRLWAAVDYRSGRYIVLVSDLVSAHQAERALQIVRSIGYEEARILTPGK